MASNKFGPSSLSSPQLLGLVQLSTDIPKKELRDEMIKRAKILLQTKREVHAIRMAELVAETLEDVSCAEDLAENLGSSSLGLLIAYDTANIAKARLEKVAAELKTSHETYKMEEECESGNYEDVRWRMYRLLVDEAILQQEVDG